MADPTTTTTTTTTTLTTPKILKDPRFRGGTKLIQRGRDGAIDIFATLLEEARTTYGEASIETAPAYFEYGNALFRESQRQAHEQQQQQQQQEDDEENDAENEEAEEDTHVKEENGNESNLIKNDDENDQKPAAVKKEKKGEEQAENSDDDDNNNNNEEKKNGNQQSTNEQQPQTKQEEQNDDNDEHAQENEEAVEEEEEEEQAEQEEEEEAEEEEEEDDAHLALSMMETAFAIFDNYLQVNDTHAPYVSWIQTVQLPRVLSCIGDVLSVLGRHADAADAYTRELAFREATLERYHKCANVQQEPSMEELRDRRKAVEANVLVAQELLSCPPGHDVVTTETNSLLVKGSELLSFATGYYENARDQLQDTVYLMGQLAGKKKIPQDEFQTEKENICFTSTLLMAVGETLAEFDEQQKQTKQEEAIEPTKKKAKR